MLPSSARTCSATMDQGNDVAQTMGKRREKAPLWELRGLLAFAVSVVYSARYCTLRLRSLTFEDFLHFTETRLAGRDLPAAEISHLLGDKGSIDPWAAYKR